ETPTVEFFDTLGVLSKTEEGKLFKLLDRQGRTLVLRPEMTTPIARVVASLLYSHPFPIRLMYLGNVFRSPSREAGKSAEFTQMGAELIGEKGLFADAEQMALAIAAVKEAGVKEFRIAMSHARFLDAYFSVWAGDDSLVSALKTALKEKNHVGFREKVKASSLSGAAKEALYRILRWHGGVEVLEEARLFSPSPEMEKCVGEMEEVYRLLMKLGFAEWLTFDLTMMAKQDYYTGLFFEGFAEGVASSVLNGGRYDHLTAEFGREAPATGFAIKVDRLLEAAHFPIERKKKSLLLYPPEQMEEAFQWAMERRAQGEIVAIHCLSQGNEEFAEEGAPPFQGIDWSRQGEELMGAFRTWEEEFEEILFIDSSGVRRLGRGATREREREGGWRKA
ncbi:MAG: ATP phosphoribosyltransferase regulatory subunit, partial [Thermicanus sp.]|nr:ATP phosphoribosyltransferase regulatory subunit [Thermicanus sp.]